MAPSPVVSQSWFAKFVRILTGKKEVHRERPSRRFWPILSCILVVGVLISLAGCDDGPPCTPPDSPKCNDQLDARAAYGRALVKGLWAFSDAWEIDPASSTIGTPPYLPAMVRQSDCSLTRLVYDSTGTLIAQNSDYQDFLHLHQGVPTTADQFTNGCTDATTGIAMEQAAVVGKLSNGNVALAVVSTDGVTVYILDGSNNTLVSQTDYSVIPGGSPSPYVGGIVSADLNGDGYPDIVVSSTPDQAGTETLTVLLGSATGTFTTGQILHPVSSLGGNGTSGVTIEDVNGDGKLDLAAISDVTSGSGLDVFLGNGNGTFQTPAITGPTGASGTLLVSADFNGDGFPDLATDSGQILLGDGTGAFTLQTQTLESPAAEVRGLAAGDFNKDGKMDLAFSNWFAYTVDVYDGNGDGTFTYAASYPMIEDGMNIDASDLDGDGYPDLFVGTAEGGAYTVGVDTGSMFESLLNYGDSTFGPTRAYLPTTGQANATCPSTTLCTGYLSYDIADFTGDGKPDIVTAFYNTTGTYLSVLAGNGDGTFHQPGTDTLVTSQQVVPSAMAALDANNDGKQDVVFAWNNASGNGQVSVALGNGNGTFQTPTDYPVPGGETFTGGFNGGDAPPMILADVNGDGKPDIVFFAAPSGSPTGSTDLYVMLNNGDGSFQSPSLIDTEPYIDYLAAGDVNGDGNADLVAVAGDPFNSVATTAYLYISNGDGTFQTPTQVGTFGSDFPGVAAIADVNGDGNQDIVFADENTAFTGGNVEVLLGNGNGTFQTGVSTPHLASSPSSIILTDLNGDGKPDLLLGCSQDCSPYAMAGNGDGTFSTSIAGFFNLGWNSSDLELKDVNGDGLPDLFLVSAGGEGGYAIEGFLGTSAPSLTATTTTLTTSPSPATITEGQNITFTATVAPQSGSGTPTGTVEFFAGTANIGTGTLDSSGVATLSTTTLSVGTHSVTASYDGDSTFASSTSSAVSVTVNGASSPDFTIASGSSSDTVNAGQTATYTITVTPTGGFNGAVNLACSDTITDSTCTEMPTSVTPSGTSAVTSTVSVSTMARSFVPGLFHIITPPVRMPRSWTLLAALALILACGYFAARKQKMRLVLSLVLLGFLGLAGCGSNGSSSSSNTGGGGGSGTPAGTYMLTITGTSGSTSHSTTVTLNVN